jgi:hypothetical protein
MIGSATPCWRSARSISAPCSSMSCSGATISCAACGSALASARIVESDFAGVIASGSRMQCRIAGLPRDRALEGGRELGGGLDPLAMAAEGAGIGGEIRVLQHRRRDAAGIVALLMHADGAVHAVVDHDDDDGRSYCTAVANSCPFIRKQPSPAKATTVRRETAAWRRSRPARHSPSSRRSARAASRTW